MSLPTGFGQRQIIDNEAQTSTEHLDNCQIKDVAYGFEDLWDQFPQWSTLIPYVCVAISLLLEIQHIDMMTFYTVQN